MCAERLHFDQDKMRYSAMLAAQHVSRYAFAAPLCTGRRVLDIACGEGYGAFMLALRGAQHVIGIDVADDAIAVARRHFSRDNLEFILGDALELPRLLDQESRFDLIVSFETMEHITDVQSFLTNLRGVLAPDGVIMLSCPNDKLEEARGITNPFHVRTYSLAEFQQTTSSILGPASQWYLGTPLQGITIIETQSRLFDNNNSELVQLVADQGQSSAITLPAQPEHRVTPETCDFYVGVWGANVEAVHVTAPMSQKAFLDPWWALCDKEKQVAFLENQIVEVRRAAYERQKQATFLEEQIVEVRRAVRLERSRISLRLQEADFRLQEAGHRLQEITLRLDVICSSRGYRLVQSYYGLYGLPGVGGVFRRLRGGVRYLRRVPARSTLKIILTSLSNRLRRIIYP